MNSKFLRIKHIFISFVMVLFLSACETSLFSSSNDAILQQDADANSSFYLNRAQQAASINEKVNYQLLAARVLLDENKIEQAAAILDELKDLNPVQTLEYYLVTTQLLIKQKKYEVADNALNNVTLAKLSGSQQARYYTLKAELLAQQNQIIEAIQQLSRAHPMIQNTLRKQDNIDRAWMLLRGLSAAQIRILNAPQGDSNVEGWLQLIYRYNTYLSQPQQLNTAISEWRSLNSTHIANRLLPSEVQDILNYRRADVNHVALVVPYSGNAKFIGEAIIKGFTDAKGSAPTQVSIYDTLEQPIDQILTQIKSQNIQFVVGPLLKQNVDNLLRTPLDSIKVLTLNMSDTPALQHNVNNVCYYGLAPEDEAKSAADIMKKDGVDSPIIIAPQNDLGQRMSQAFSLRWLEITGVDAQTQFYNNNADIVAALTSGISNVANSQKVGLYMLSDNNELLNIANLINNRQDHQRFNIYTYSRTNSPNNTADYRLALEGVKFSDIPFIVNQSAENYQRASSELNGDYSLLRLYAMGSDAWLLINNFNEIYQIPGYNLSGLSGRLSSNTKNNLCQIERDLIWLQYSQGYIRGAN